MTYIYCYMSMSRSICSKDYTALFTVYTQCCICVEIQIQVLFIYKTLNDTRIDLGELL